MTYSNLSLQRGNFEEIEVLGKQAGILDGTAGFDDYVDARFSDEAEKRKASYEYSAERALMDSNR